METNRSMRNVRIETGVHPAVYAILAGCVLWVVAAAAIFFAADRYAALQLAVVAVFSAAFLLTPVWIYKLSGKKLRPGSFGDWLASEIALPDGTLGAKKALVMILSAPMAGVGGITLVSFVAHLAAIGAI